jgi:hypothetical protein
MVYKPLAVRVALIAGVRRPLPVFKYMIVVAVAVVMWDSPQGFSRGVAGVESRLYGFPCFPYPGISMACFWTRLGFGFIVSDVLNLEQTPETRQKMSWDMDVGNLRQVRANE